MRYFVPGISKKKWLLCMTVHTILPSQPKDQTCTFISLWLKELAIIPGLESSSENFLTSLSFFSSCTNRGKRVGFQLLFLWSKTLVPCTDKL